MADIHPTAIIASGAELGNDVSIGPYAVVEPDTAVGEGCRILSHAVLKRYTRLGRRNVVHEHAVLGGLPQDLQFDDCATWLVIGDDNVIREGVTLHRSKYEGAETRVGNNNYLMAYCHAGHDCAIGNHVVIANGALLGGHVQVADRAFISGAVGIHQFCRVGALAMVGHNSKVNQDCLPFVITDGVPARARGLNQVGLKRAGVGANDRKALKEAYRLLASGELRRDEALARLEGRGSALVDELVAFIRASKRGVARPGRGG